MKTKMLNSCVLLVYEFEIADLPSRPYFKFMYNKIFCWKKDDAQRKHDGSETAYS